MPDHDSTHPDVLITADSHVGETEALRERLPEHLRPFLTRQVPANSGDLDFEYAGEVSVFPSRGSSPIAIEKRNSGLTPRWEPTSIADCTTWHAKASTPR